LTYAEALARLRRVLGGRDTATLYTDERLQEYIMAAQAVVYGDLVRAVPDALSVLTAEIVPVSAPAGFVTVLQPVTVPGGYGGVRRVFEVSGTEIVDRLTPAPLADVTAAHASGQQYPGLYYWQHSSQSIFISSNEQRTYRCLMLRDAEAADVFVIPATGSLLQGLATPIHLAVVYQAAVIACEAMDRPSRGYAATYDRLWDAALPQLRGQVDIAFGGDSV